MQIKSNNPNFGSGPIIGGWSNDHRNDDELYYVFRHCKCGSEDNIDQYVTVVATNPTTADENWVKLEPDEMRVFYQGKVL